jgi:superfamily II DNA helicase RecQ
MVRYTLEQCVFLHDTYLKNGSAKSVSKNFNINFMMKEFTVDKKQKHKSRVLTEETLYGIGARLQHTPRKSLKRVAQETGESEPNAGRATQVLKLRPYKTRVIHACSRVIQLAEFIFAVGFYSLSSKVRSICS